MRTEAESFAYLREMLERQATQVARRYPEQSGPLWRALELVQREGVTFAEAAAAAVPNPDSVVLEKGERILGFLVQAEHEVPNRLEELELMVAAILDRDL
jgi:hypothetical protein